MEFDYPSGATPLDPDEAAGLKLSHITNRAELDRWELGNILEAEEWAFRRRIPVDELLSVNFLLKLHKRMLGNVWKWAGSFRNSEKNLGVPCWSIGPDLKHMLEDIKFWIVGNVYQPDEISTRLHHRLVSIHLFANGNGRHARLVSDLLLVHVLDRPRFTWGGRNLVQSGECRESYINALRAADNRDYSLLLDFVRS
ncbi:MAG: mobile mystery protein B [Thermodesulfobacteriota bacterium]